ncbi:protein of unknown function [Eubacterium ruminantium]|uniref:MrfA-like Zn-binding domain-containing protein n=1 Tax=Eubacterium ruminantium TaxID=42322 RepID=A0A1T4KR54_9FIRM|nr:DrmB family protein [Eubacterium ruminantium]SCW34127.1 protein of unknown function [Eubacterium ruminantium]SDM32325.1 protein of unknown function [Eubacterium ruminantium]SJZ44860.1 protein of unknown function [Eubacterium ruminantium]
METIREKIPLNKIEYSVRATQAVLQYGVGAMVDFASQTLVTAAPETWSSVQKIYDERFAKALGVEYFALPIKITYSRFPEWYFCPKCRDFMPIDHWIKRWKEKVQKNGNLRKVYENDSYLIKHMRCPDCYQDLVVSRIVTVCKSGHLNDFPWVEWVHAKSNRTCDNPVLKFKTGASGTEGLEGLTIECSCKAKATLKDAFDEDIFKTLAEEKGTSAFFCQGNHPFKHTKHKCINYPVTKQRGASSVYYPVEYSSLVIPPYSDKLNEKIENSKAFEKYCGVIEEEEPEDRIPKINKKLSEWTAKIALEIGAIESDVEKILRRKWLDEYESTDVSSIQYKMDEYDALTGEIVSPSGGFGDFSREEMDVSIYNLPHIKSISLIDKVRVVRALIGFSRINPVVNMEDEGFVSVKEDSTPFYPANEVRGEGIFIEFDFNDISDWISDNPEVIERTNQLNSNYAASYFGSKHPRIVTPKFILLHTLAHLLITQLSFECGYNVASLSEKIYCSETSDGKEMAGIFIYTASGDSEGTLGGLVRQGRPDAFPKIFKKAINHAKTCSNDPICIMSRGQGRDSLNLAACHSCAMVPETSCEENNTFLDRGMVVGLFDNKKIGFWN